MENEEIPEAPIGDIVEIRSDAKELQDKLSKRREELGAENFKVSPNQIIENLYLGSRSDARNVSVLEEKKLSAILNLAELKVDRKLHISLNIISTIKIILQRNGIRH